MSYNLRLVLAAEGNCPIGQMRAVGADIQGADYMADKARFYILRGDGLLNPAALILKQEALSKGAEAVIHRLVIVNKIEKSGFLLMGTERQLRQIGEKLSRQAFGLQKLALEIEEALNNILIKEWEIPCTPKPLKLGGKTLIMGIVNITPDSFSDGGEFFNTQKAIDHALALEAAGADIIDIGGASSRPGFTPVPLQEEISRVLPVIEGLLLGKIKVPISIDSDKPPVVTEALKAGAAIINDIRGLQGAGEMAQVASRTKAPLIIMHQGYNKADGPGEICAYFRRSLEIAQEAGIDKEQIILDPGLGFGKDTLDNLEIIRNLEAFKVLGRPLLMGGSNKRFVGDITGLPLGRRLSGNLGWVGASIQKGAAIIRVHEVEETRRFTAMADAIKGAPAYEE